MNTQGCHVLGTVKEMCSLEERKLRERTKRLSVFEIEQGSKGRSNERLAVSCYSRVAVGAGEILLVFNYSDTLLFFRWETAAFQVETSKRFSEILELSSRFYHGSCPSIQQDFSRCLWIYCWQMPRNYARNKSTAAPKLGNCWYNGTDDTLSYN